MFKRKLLGMLQPAVFASALLGALAAGYALSPAAQWQCTKPKVTYDDGCTCEQRGCKLSKEGVEDAFHVCDYVKSTQCGSNFTCPPLDECTKNSIWLE